MSRYRTTDGRPLSMGISGFTHYDTERLDAPDHPSPVYSPEDLLKRIKEIREVLSDDRYNTAITTFNEHVEDLNNPHQTTLNQFTDDIIDVLYEKYIELGGASDKEFYTHSLFQVLRIATEQELQDASKELEDNVLLSVAHARRFLLAHEVDADAHHELFQSIFPGYPTQDPVFGIMGDFGIASKFIEQVNGTSFNFPYSYVSKNGYIKYCSSINELPIDFSYGEGMIPCFGTRTNLLTESTNFESVSKYNTTHITNAEMSPDTNLDATAVFATEDQNAKEHGITIENVYLPAKNARTFSIFAKAEKCRYLAIRYQDLGSNDIMIVNGIYDLKKGTCMCMNHMNRYKTYMIPLANGWFRCCFTMYHDLGQEEDLKVLFFYADNEEDFTFTGKAELCGYLWGMQLEDGINASPFIKTAGFSLTRKGLKIVINLNNSEIPKDKFTIDTDILNPGIINNQNVIRPLLSLYKKVDNNYILSSLSEYRSIGSIDVTTYSTIKVGLNEVLTATSQLVFPPDNDAKYLQMVYGADKDSTVHRCNKTTPITMRNVDEWNKPDFLYIGCNREGSFMDTYLKAVIAYPYRVSEDEAVFLTSEQIHG